jgi:hypothetical protein
MTRIVPRYWHLIFIVGIQSLNFKEQDVTSVEINGPKRCFHLMSTEATLLEALLRHTNGLAIYDHGKSDLSIFIWKPYRTRGSRYSHTTLTPRNVD